MQDSRLGQNKQHGLLLLLRQSIYSRLAGYEAGAAQEYSAMVVDDAAGEVGKDRGEGDSALEVRDVPTGGGRRAATTVRSDSGADQTACDSFAGVSIRLEAPVGRIQSGCWRERKGMHGLRAENDNRPNFAEGASSIGTAWGPGCRRENQRAYWNFTQLLGSMGGIAARSVSERRPNGKYGFTSPRCHTRRSWTSMKRAPKPPPPALQ